MPDLPGPHSSPASSQLTGFARRRPVYPGFSRTWNLSAPSNIRFRAAAPRTPSSLVGPTTTMVPFSSFLANPGRLFSRAGRRRSSGMMTAFTQPELSAHLGPAGRAHLVSKLGGTPSSIIPRPPLLILDRAPGLGGDATIRLSSGPTSANPRRTAGPCLVSVLVLRDCGVREAWLGAPCFASRGIRLGVDRSPGSPRAKKTPLWVPCPAILCSAPGLPFVCFDRHETGRLTPPPRDAVSSWRGLAKTTTAPLPAAPVAGAWGAAKKLDWRTTWAPLIPCSPSAPRWAG